MTHLRTDPDYDAKISVLYRCGLSTAQVAARLGVSKGMVLDALKRTGTPRRSHGEAMRLRHDLYLQSGAI